MTLARRIPILVVLPPRVLLLDLAGPLEVLRVAGATQDQVRFDVTFAAPQITTQSSVGLALSGAGPLPQMIEDDAMILLPGSSSRLVELERLAWLENQRHEHAAPDGSAPCVRSPTSPAPLPKRHGSLRQLTQAPRGITVV